MHYWHFVVTGMLLLALVMTGGCAGLLMGDLKTEIRDTSSITIPLPVSSVLSVLVGQKNTALPSARFPTEEKGEFIPVTPSESSSAFHVKPALTDSSGKSPSLISGEPGDLPLSGSGTTGVPIGGIASCSPVDGAQVEVTLIGLPHGIHIGDCITRDNGDFSFDMPPSIKKSTTGQYTFNFAISAPGYNLPAGSSTLVTDMVNASDGPRYTFNVCLQQPSEPNAVAFTRGGIAVIGKIRS